MPPGRPKKVNADEARALATKDIPNIGQSIENPIDKLNEDDFLRSLKELKQEFTPKIKISLVREGAIFQRANEFAAGFDVKAFNPTVEDGYLKFMLGIKSEMPAGWYAEVIHRSSNSKYDTILANTKGTIDCDFRGEWQARLKILPKVDAYIYEVKGFENRHFQIKQGTQPLDTWKDGEIALQVIFHKLPIFEVVEVDESELQPSQRGEGGFGSTGTGL